MSIRVPVEEGDLTFKLATCTNMAVIEKFKTYFPVYIGLVSVNFANTQQFSQIHTFLYSLLYQLKAEPENWLGGYMFTSKQLTGLYTLDQLTTYDSEACVSDLRFRCCPYIRRRRTDH